MRGTTLAFVCLLLTAMACGGGRSKVSLLADDVLADDAPATKSGSYGQDSQGLATFFGGGNYSSWSARTGSGFAVTNTRTRPAWWVAHKTTSPSCPMYMSNSGLGTCVCNISAEHPFGVPWCPWKVGDPTVHPSCPSNSTLVSTACYYNDCPIGYVSLGNGLLGCQLRKIDEAFADYFFSESLQTYANLTGAWFYYGIGVSATGTKPFPAAGGSNQVGAETGVIHGPNNRFGYYTSTCRGLSTTPGLGAYMVAGGINTIENFVGNGRQWSVGAGVPGLKYAGGAATIAMDESGQPAGGSTQFSVGIDAFPFSASTATCDSTYKELRPVPVAPTKPADASDGSPGNTFYTVGPNGHLHKTHHSGAGPFDLVNAQIGQSWAVAEKIFAAEGGHVYAIMPDGKLRYYHHNGTTWDNVGQEIGNGWAGLAFAWAGRFGEIYAVFPDGTLRYYKHGTDLKFYWSGTIGSGWNVPGSRVIGGGHRAIYVIKGGKLHYWYHDAQNKFVVYDKVIGTAGWDLPVVASTGNGEIYTVDASGDLYYYRHDANHVFMNNGVGKRVGNGWTVWTNNKFGLIPSAY